MEVIGGGMCRVVIIIPAWFTMAPPWFTMLPLPIPDCPAAAAEELLPATVITGCGCCGADDIID